MPKCYYNVPLHGRFIPTKEAALRIAGLTREATLNTMSGIAEEERDLGKKINGAYRTIEVEENSIYSHSITAETGVVDEKRAVEESKQALSSNNPEAVRRLSMAQNKELYPNSLPPLNGTASVPSFGTIDGENGTDPDVHLPLDYFHNKNYDNDKFPPDYWSSMREERQAAHVSKDASIEEQNCFGVEWFMQEM